MIMLLDKLITSAMNQVANKQGDKIAAIEITNSYIKVYSQVEYEVQDRSIGTVFERGVTVFEDRNNIHLEYVDSYLRRRNRVKAIPSQTEPKGTINNIRVMQKINETHSLHLIVRDLYFSDTYEGARTIEALQIYPDEIKVDARLSLVEYQASEIKDLIIAQGIKYNYPTVAYDTKFRTLFGIRDNNYTRINTNFNLDRVGLKALSFDALAYGYQTSHSKKMMFLAAEMEQPSDTVLGQWRYYYLPDLEPKISTELKELISDKSKPGITIISNLMISDVNNLFPRRDNEMAMASALTLEYVQAHPRVDITTYSEYSRGENPTTDITKFIKMQRRILLERKSDIVIVENILDMEDGEILKRTARKQRVVILSDVENMDDLADELNILPEQVKKEIVYRLDSFAKINRGEKETLTIVDSFMKNELLKGVDY